jgi:hypothetical protein
VRQWFVFKRLRTLDLVVTRDGETGEIEEIEVERALTEEPGTQANFNERSDEEPFFPASGIGKTQDILLLRRPVPTNKPRIGF